MGGRGILTADLDNRWAYEHTHRVDGWDDYETYLPTAIPRLVGLAADLRVPLTAFVVGRDAADARNADSLRSLTDASHEVANHSFSHDPQLGLRPRDDIEADIARSADAIEEACGVRPVGFRGPAYSCSVDLLRTLAAQGYRWDSSTYPTMIGPVAKRFMLRELATAGHTLDAAERAELDAMYGPLGDARLPLKPFRWTGDATVAHIDELPVTVLPGLRTPIHFSYVHLLAERSPGLAKRYVALAMRACRLLRVTPCLLLHPLDVLGSDDVPEMAFFPGMDRSGREKADFVADVLAHVGAGPSWLTITQHLDMTTLRGTVSLTALEHRQPGSR